MGYTIIVIVTIIKLEGEVMKYSKQRQLIEMAVTQNRVHPTAEQVYNVVKKQSPNVSLGTVYRNLNLLAENGIIKKITMANESDHYDGTITEHYHIICECCSQMIDCPDVPLIQYDGLIKDKTGFTVTSHSLVIYGLCKECQISTNTD